MKGTSDLLQAVRNGDLDGVEALLRKDPALAAAKDETGMTALMSAVYMGQMDIARRLARGRRDLSIFEATVLGRIERVRELIEAIPEAVHAISPDGFNPLGYAAFFGSIEAVTLLLSKGANPNTVSRNALGVAPLHSALAGGQTAIALLLLNSGAQVNLPNAEGWTPLHYAADIGDAEIASLLMELGADHTVTDHNGKTAAQLAADVGHDHVAETILEAVGVE